MLHHIHTYTHLCRYVTQVHTHYCKNVFILGHCFYTKIFQIKYILESVSFYIGTSYFFN